MYPTMYVKQRGQRGQGPLLNAAVKGIYHAGMLPLNIAKYTALGIGALLPSGNSEGSGSKRRKVKKGGKVKKSKAKRK